MTREGGPAGGRYDARLTASLLAVALSGGTLALAAFLFFGPTGGVSAGVGAGLAVGNLWALARIVSGLLPEDAESSRQQSRTAWALLGAMKMLALLLITWLLMRRGLVFPMPMLVGFLSLPIGIAIGSLVSDRSAAKNDF